MRTIAIFFFWLIVLLSPCFSEEKKANDFSNPLEIIQKEGVLCLSDGSSLYVFRKDHTFKSTPTGVSGREINGTWKSKGNPNIFRIEGQWSWINGISAVDDFREMTMILYPLSGEKEAHPPPYWLHPPDVKYIYKGYFIIDELKKK